MNESVRVLIIEDNEDDALLEVDELMNGGFNIVFERVETREAMRAALTNCTWDCIISDYSLPRFSGLDALKELNATGEDIPFILISGTMGEETAVAAMKAGAHDYIMKNNLKRLIPAFERELREARVRNSKRQAEEAVRFERSLLRTLIDNLPDLIYIKDAGCRKIAANKADIEFTGYTSEAEIIGKTDLEIFTGDTGKRGYEDDLSIIKNGRPTLNQEEEFFDATGKKRWLLTSKIPIHNGHGQISGLVGLGHDITERKQFELALKKQNDEYFALNEEYVALNEELTESLERIQKMNTELIIAKERAEESDKLKSAFLANISHEIRTPLNAIMGFSGFLKDGDLANEKTEKFVDIIQSSGQQLLTIIEDILDISKIEAGQITISSEVVNIAKLLKELYQQFKKSAELKNLDLLLIMDYPSDGIITSTDENRLRQILGNLLDNAIKFTPSGEVEFGYTVEGNLIEFYVRDTGIGIAQEHQSMIFKPFRQVETEISRTYGGNGLGLSISKALVEKLSGTISLNSELGKGTTLLFTIPFVKCIEPNSQAKLITEQELSQNWENHTILVAEDELYNYAYIEAILSTTNVKVLHAWDGKEAVELVKAHSDISLVLMDIKMPVMDGFTAMRQIKELRPQLPVIAQTAHAFSDEKERALKSGFDSYLIKPVSQKSFMEIIGSYLN